jgi:hypothetical protein
MIKNEYYDDLDFETKRYLVRLTKDINEPFDCKKLRVYIDGEGVYDHIFKSMTEIDEYFDNHQSLYVLDADTECMVAKREDDEWQFNLSCLKL